MMNRILDSWGIGRPKRRLIQFLIFEIRRSASGSQQLERHNDDTTSQQDSTIVLGGPTVQQCYSRIVKSWRPYGDSRSGHHQKQKHKVTRQLLGIISVSFLETWRYLVSSPSKAELAIYAIEQRDITTAIETLLLGHVNGSDSEKLPKRVIIREDRLLGYVLVGERRQWTYGRRKQFYWGGHPLRSSEDKWVFYFETTKLQVNYPGRRV
ncbi:uncharacterized protein BJ212DRAFT_617112 [Suillus subaureus]|uniref:Uncharacterized protein n=1 Tax=Suillus subaureus TaxID=48587 RepID=A0A9P7E1Z5_9AGAM|nr:uncharacterized protein BJ212DRAFT_617112 [Suillus subaureus]KAG1809125.1 hypothetical protein BJ212DRAFT_617112 [Suillus subaureus]